MDVALDAYVQLSAVTSPVILPDGQVIPGAIQASEVESWCRMNGMPDPNEQHMIWEIVRRIPGAVRATEKEREAEDMSKPLVEIRVREKPKVDSRS